MPHGSEAPICQYGRMTPRSYISGALLRIVLVAALVLQGMIAGALATRMATAQAVAGPGDTVVICTPEGFKAVPWSDVSENQIPRAFGCACPCTALCGSCGPGAPAFPASVVDYGEDRQALVRKDGLSSSVYGSCAVSCGAARAPPSHAI